MNTALEELIIYWKDRLAKYRTPGLHWQVRQTISCLEELQALKKFGYIELKKGNQKE
jgi:hypothetical protein